MFGEMVGAALADCWKRAGRAGRRDLCRAWARAGERWRPMRCACCAQAGFAGDVHLVETSPVLRDAQARAVAGCALARDDRGASRPRRCCSSPTNSSTRCRSASIVDGIERRVTIAGRRSRVRPRRRDRRDFACARRGGRRAIASHARRKRRRRADHRLWPRAQRARRHAAGGARPRASRRCSPIRASRT